MSADALIETLRGIDDRELTVRQLRVLLVMAREGGSVRHCDLAALIDCSAGATSRAVGRLGLLGYMKRTRPRDSAVGGDFRATFHQLTEAGRVLARALSASAVAQERAR